MMRARWETLGSHTLIRGDCARVLKRLEPGSVDVVVTSPPYNLGLAYLSYTDQRAEGDYLDWLAGICASIRDVMRDNGSFFLNIAGSSAQPWLPFELMVRLRGMFVLQNHITWVKSISIGDVTFGHFKPVNSTRYINRNHEHIFHLTKHGDVPVERLGAGVPFTDKSNILRRSHEVDRRCRGDTWFIPYETVRSRREKFSHPGTFPVALPETCLRLHGITPDTVVLDPFMGSGTSVVAAHKAGVRGIGIESDTRYVRVARERLRAFMEVGADEEESA